jgi:hypothetical protein
VITLDMQCNDPIEILTVVEDIAADMGWAMKDMRLSGRLWYVRQMRLRASDVELISSDDERCEIKVFLTSGPLRIGTATEDGVSLFHSGEHVAQFAVAIPYLAGEKGYWRDLYEKGSV